MNPFAGVGIWTFNFKGSGTVLTAADAAAYKAAGVDWAAVKVSDGTVGGGPGVIAQIQAAVAGGLQVIPWGFMYNAYSAAQQLADLKSAAGGGYSCGILDIEEYVNVLDFTGFDGLITALCSWGDPDSHPNAPSIGLFNDIGVTAQLPQAYSGAWKVSAAQAIATAMGQYNAIKPVPAICPVNDQGDNLLAFALAAKAAGCAGISAWRHGANGVSPASFAGVAEVFAPPAPTPTPTPTPAPAPSEQVLVAGTPYQTPKGDTITIS